MRNARVAYCELEDAHQAGSYQNIGSTSGVTSTYRHSNMARWVVPKFPRLVPTRYRPARKRKTADMCHFTFSFNITNFSAKFVHY